MGIIIKKEAKVKPMPIKMLLRAEAIITTASSKTTTLEILLRAPPIESFTANSCDRWLNVKSVNIMLEVIG